MQYRLPAVPTRHMSIQMEHETRMFAFHRTLRALERLTKHLVTPRRTLAGSAGGFLVWGGLLPPLRPTGRAPPAVPHGGADAPRLRRACGAGAARGRSGCGGKAGGVRALALRPLRARGGVTGVYRRWCSLGRVRGLLSLGARSWRRAWAPALWGFWGFGGGYGAGAPALSAMPCAPSRHPPRALSRSAPPPLSLRYPSAPSPLPRALRTAPHPPCRRTRADPDPHPLRVRTAPAAHPRRRAACRGSGGAAPA